MSSARNGKERNVPRKRSRFTAAMWGIFGLVAGFALGNFLPDYTDVIYFADVANGSISNPAVAIEVYYIWPGLFWGVVLAFIAFGFAEGFLQVRHAVWIIAIIIVTSTVAIAAIVNPLIPHYNISFDIVLSAAAVLSVLYVEGKLSLERLRAVASKQPARRPAKRSGPRPAKRAR